MNYENYLQAQKLYNQAREQMERITTPALTDLSLIPQIIKEARCSEETLVCAVCLLYEPRILWEQRRIRRGIQKALSEAMDCTKFHISRLIHRLRWLYQHSQSLRERAEATAMLYLRREEERRRKLISK